MGHRRFLPIDHKWRDEIKAFDGNKNHRSAPVLLSREEIIEQLSSIEQVQFGKEVSSTTTNKKGKKRKRARRKNRLKNKHNWKKRSIFFELPYWKSLKMRHNLDVMHVEKNVCDNILGTLMNISGKTRDNKKARKDLMEKGLKSNLHLQGESEDMPPASYTLSHDQKKIFCDFLSSVKFPDGFASNISRCVKEKELTISGLKSHDCHVLLQCLLSLATRGYLHKEVYEILLEVSDFFRKLCSKTLYLDVLDKMEKHMALTLCKLERIFPPAFFDVMIHLMIHLASEAKVAGPVQYRWMFPFERCDWWNLNDRSGIQMDKNSSITSVNVCKTWYNDQPFVLAYQVRQVFYLQDLKLGKNWRIVEKTQPRGTYDIPNQKHVESNDLEDPYQEEAPEEAYLFDD
ncbi:UNVERIFIED_CONTAM: hypothetical protein Sradi_0830300 [Sesamum radiatum]|uniref:DUF4218 domain-containing protein n=1 Tax=Sesamum radiatum TaxID=300843 RepID=A0AAW2VS13_SESRA